MTTARVLGPALAGFLIGWVGYAWCFLGDGFSYLAVIAGLAMMRRQELPIAKAPTVKTTAVEETNRGRGQVREGLQYAFSSREQLVPLVMMAVVGTFAFNLSVTTPLLVTGPLNGTDQAYTLVLSTMAVGSVAGAIATARRRTVPFGHLIWSTVAFGISLLLLAGAPTLWTTYPIAVLVGLGSIAFMTTSTAMMQLAADPQFRGRVLSLQAMVFLGTTPIGAPFVGWVADRFGPRAAILIGAFACFAAAVWGWRSWRGRAVLPASTTPPVLVD